MRRRALPGRLFATVLSLVVLLGGCASLPPAETRNTVAYVTTDDTSVAARYAPVIVPEYPGPSYNRVGRPGVRVDDAGRETLLVEPDRAAIYVQRLPFETARGGRYTNLVYRVHFERVPWSLIPFHLTAGRNPGLLLLVTLDSKDRPVLLTTVHTCGCYLAMVPTSYLPASARPAGWDAAGQRVFGMNLPGVLEYPAQFDTDWRPVVFLHHGTHRVRRIGLARRSVLSEHYAEVPLEVVPMTALRQLPTTDGKTTSFYRDAGFRRGYVKGASKPLELLFMSWWSLDLNVGVDKEYGDRDDTGTVFYTSLKPWRRSDSDMWRFADFLEYWGWRL